MALDKLVDSTQLDADLTSVANAIRTKGGTSAQLAFPAGFVSAIGDIPTGGGDEGVPNLKDVVFIDYDGTIVQQYTKAEFLALDAMPANPSHSGLTAQGWNWSLADAKTYVTANGMLVVGQSYTTDNGRTKVYVAIVDELIGAEFSFKITTTVKNGVTVYWGDGTSSVSSGNANATSTLSHSYNSAGDYVIEFECTSGTFILGGSGINEQFIQTEFFRCSVTAAEIGNKCTGSNTRGTFGGCRYLRSCTMPNTFLTLGSGIFNDTMIKAIVVPSGASASAYLANGCHGTRFISLPKGYTGSVHDGNLFYVLMMTYPETATEWYRPFNNCYAAQKGCVPGTYTSMSANAFRECRTIRKVTIPASVTSIPQWALHPVQNIREYHFLPTSPPTLASTSNMFTVNSNVKIYVPYSADHSILNAYKTATNWTSFASYIEEEPQ